MAEQQNAVATRPEQVLTPQLLMLNKLAGPKMAEAIKAVAPSYCDPARFLTIAMSAAKAMLADPDIEPNSLLISIFDAAKLGLYLDRQLQHAALVAYRDRNLGVKIVQCQPMYKGLIHMARESSNELKDIKPYIVYAADDFRTWNDVDGPHFEHNISLDEGRETSRVLGVYTLSWFEGEERPRYYWTGIDKVKRIEAHATKGKHDGKAWRDKNTWADMVLKTGVRQTLKWLDLSPQVSTALGIESAIEAAKISTPKPIPADEIADLIDVDYRDSLQEEADMAAEGGKPDVSDTVEVQDEPAEMSPVEAAQAEIGGGAPDDKAEAPESPQNGGEEPTSKNEPAPEPSGQQEMGLDDAAKQAHMAQKEFCDIVREAAGVVKMTEDAICAILEEEFGVKGGLDQVKPEDYNRVVDHFIGKAEEG